MKKNSFFIRLICVCFALMLAIPAAACDKDKDQSSTPAVYYTVEFNSFGGSSVPTQSVKEGTTAVRPADPTRGGYVFNGWYYMGTEWSFDTAITSNIKLTANWIDASKNYRVTVGVESVYSGRGSVQIVGKSGTMATISGGSGVTVKATANEGFAFSAWVDFYTNEVVSTDAEYTFKLTGDVTYKATFVHVAIGTDDPANAALLEGLDGMDLTSASVTLKLGGKNVNESIELAYDRRTGLAYVKWYFTDTGVIIKQIWIEYKNGAYSYYEGGAEGLEPAYPSTSLKMLGYSFFWKDDENLRRQASAYLKMMTDQLTAEEKAELPVGFIDGITAYVKNGKLNEADRQQVILTVYSALRDSLTADGQGNYSFTAPAEGLLTAASAGLDKMGDKTVKLAVYSVLKPMADAFVSAGSVEGVDFSTMTVEQLLDYVATLMGEDPFTFKKNLRNSVVDALDEIQDIATAYGEKADVEELSAVLDFYDQLLTCTLTEAAEKFNDGTTKFTPESVEEIIAGGYPLSLSLIEAVYGNMTVTDIVRIAVNRFGLEGTEWDVTDPSADYSAATVVGRLSLNGGAITEITALLGREDAGMTVTFKPGISITERN